MPVADSAVGAILEIPPQALGMIKRANDALLTLHETSRKTADQIYGDFARRMPDGIQKFVEKLGEANSALTKLASKRKADNISKLAQSLASLRVDPNSFKSMDDSIRSASANLDQFVRKSKNYGKGSGQQNNLRGTMDLSGINSSIEKFKEQERALYSDMLRIQNLINQLQNERINIKFNLNADFQNQIATLTSRLRELRQLTQQPLGVDKLREYYREIDIIKEKIAAATAAFKSQRGQNPALIGNAEQIDALQRRLIALRGEFDKIVALENKMQLNKIGMLESNEAIKAQADRVRVLEQRLVRLNDIWERLKATNQADDSSGNLTGKSKRLLAVRNEVKDELALRRMSADEAAKYEQRKTRDAERGAKKQAKAVRESLNEQKKASISNPLGAINFAKNANNLRSLTEAYKNLKLVMSTTDPKSAAWTAMNAQLEKTKQRIDNIKGKMGDLTKQTSQTSNMMGQLQSRIAAAFSVDAIMGFIRKMVDVRAEFQLQQTALRAILQDKDEADKIFMQVQQMALQSPFSIMQVTTFAKQLAAYRIEADKLVETTKALADVSAGLGVSMDRLILAYGQVKSANYLRAAEVRQFTEAGLNIAGELATYFSELKGTTVTVGEVMDMISKRMVKFEDVEEIFRRITSAGGMFYDMQKKQSDTIRGQILRISDAYSIMMNDIGTANESTISRALETIRELLSQWRKIVPLLATIGTIVATTFSIRAIVGFVQMMNTIVYQTQLLILKWRGVETAAERAEIAQKRASSATAIGLAITIVTMLASAIAGAYMEAQKLNDELDRIREEGYSDAWNLVFRFRELAATIKDSSTSYEEYQSAVEELQRTYKDILPDEMLEAENIKNISDGYKDATEAIMAYQAAKVKQKQQEAIETQYGKDIDKAIKRNASAFSAATYKEALLFPDIMTMDRDIYENAVRNIMQTIANEIKAEELPVERATEEFKNRFMEIFNIDPQRMSRASESFQKSLQLVFDDVNYGQVYAMDGLKSVIDKMNKDLGLLTDIGFVSVKDKEANDTIEKYNALEQAVQNYISAIRNLYELQQSGDINAQGLAVTDEGTKGINDFNTALADLNQNSKQFGLDYTATTGAVLSGIHSQIDLTLKLDKIHGNIMGKILNRQDNWGRKLQNNAYFNNFIENAKKGLYTISDTQKDIFGIIEQVASKTGVSVEFLEKIGIKATESYSTARAAAKGLIGQQEDLKNQIQAAINAYTEQGMAAWMAKAVAEARFGQGQALEEIEKQIKGAQMLFASLGGYESQKSQKSKKTKSGKSEDKELERWRQTLELIKEVNTAYENYREKFGETEAIERVHDIYGRLFKELKLDINDFYRDGKYDLEALEKAFEIFIGTIRQGTKERDKFYSDVLTDKAEVRVEIDTKAQEKAIEDAKKKIDALFSNYELTKKLADADININLAYMVGGEPITLEELQKRLKDGFKSVGGENAPREIVEAYKDADKKLTESIVNAQKDRLKSYEKYLKQMYSDRAKEMIKSYTMMMNIERDFADYRAKLEAELNAEGTSDERKKQIAEEITMLEHQATEAINGVRRELDEKLNKFDWNEFKGGDVFTKLYSDLKSLSGNGIDMLINRLEIMRQKLQSMDNVDYRAVRELTQYIEKLKNAKIETSSWKDLNKEISKAKDVLGDKTMEQAQMDLMSAEERLVDYKEEISLLESIIALKGKGGKEEDKIKNLSYEQLSLYHLTNEQLQNRLKNARQGAKVAEGQVDATSNEVDAAQRIIAIQKKKIAIVEMLKEDFDKVYDSVVSVAEALGADTDIWGDFGKAIGDSVFSVITLTIQLEIMGETANSALGVIGYVAIALQTVAQLLVAIFSAHDKKLQKQIEGTQERVDRLGKAFDKLKSSIDNAFEAAVLKSASNGALRNLEAQRKAYSEMIALEEQKKKKDEDKIKEWRDKQEEIAEQMRELRETITEQWGGFGSQDNFFSAVQAFAETWLDAFKETGDGLDALNEKWEEYLNNLISRQIMLRVVGPRMKQFLEMVDRYVSEGSEGEELLTRSELDALKNSKNALFGNLNEELKDLMAILGVGGGTGDLGLSDLQKGIQNITEPQAAAIEAYLNSMRFAVFRHTEQLDELILSIRDQYSGVNQSILTEVRDIRQLLSGVKKSLDSVISSAAGRGSYIKVN